MYSFYGGPQGKSFEISLIAPTRASLIDDLTLASSSPVGISEYVYIHYGIQGTEAYNENKNRDKKIYNNNDDNDKNFEIANFNGTIWQKIYASEISNNLNPIDYELNTDNKYGYICVASITGITPDISVSKEVLPPAENPIVEVDKSKGIDEPNIIFSLPRAAKFHMIAAIEDNIPYEIWEYNKETDEITSNKLVITEEYLTGDYFIDERNGDIYYITQSNLQVQLDYRGCLQSKFINEATVTTSQQIYKYTGEGFSKIAPIITLNNNTPSKEWQFTIDTNENLNYKFNTETLNSTKKADVSGEIVVLDSNGNVKENPEEGDTTSTYQFNFKIPRGSKIVTIDYEAEEGDFYIENDIDSNGINKTVLYRKGKDGFFTEIADLTGSVGPSLNFYTKSFAITNEEIEANPSEMFNKGGVASEKEIAFYLKYVLEGTQKRDDDLKNALQDLSENTLLQLTQECLEIKDFGEGYLQYGGNVVERLYYYVNKLINSKSEISFVVQRLTGGAGNLLENEYTLNNSEDKAYSVKVINENFLLKETMTWKKMG